MTDNRNGCGGGVLDNFTFCDKETQTSSSDTEIIMDAETIQLTDQILIVRQNGKETRVYKASFNDMSADIPLCINNTALTIGQNGNNDSYFRCQMQIFLLKIQIILLLPLLKNLVFHIVQCKIQDT